MSSRRSALAATTALALFATIGGCAPRPPANDPDALEEYKQTHDPLEPTNRVLFAINNGIDAVILRPVAVGYNYAVPEPVRTHVHNVLTNLSSPVVLANDMMQGKSHRAGDTLMRFVINSTLGLGGMFEVADGWGYPYHSNDFGLTMAIWGIPEGPFLFLPVLGPSDPRDAVGVGADIAMDPITWLPGNLATNLGYVRFGMTAVDTRAGLLGTLDKIEAQALDPYATLRSLYRQSRQSKVDDIRNDTTATQPSWYPAPAKP
jgi:phospholipid-binding lipoprotein MlaA